jgi:hypothetical protein
MRKIPDEAKRQRGTYRKTADKRSWAGRVQRAPRSDRSPQLSQEQQALLVAIPEDLQGEAKDCYERSIKAAPWLRMIDRGALTCYSHASAMHSVASRQLDKCLEDPTFLYPKSEASQAGKIYLRIVARQAALIMQWSDLLGFNPRARARIGIAVAELPPEDNPNDPWKALQLLPGGKADQPDA